MITLGAFHGVVRFQYLLCSFYTEGTILQLRTPNMLSLKICRVLSINSVLQRLVLGFCLL